MPGASSVSRRFSMNSRISRRRLVRVHLVADHQQHVGPVVPGREPLRERRQRVRAVHLGRPGRHPARPERDPPLGVRRGRTDPARRLSGLRPHVLAVEEHLVRRVRPGLQAGHLDQGVVVPVDGERTRGGVQDAHLARFGRLHPDGGGFSVDEPEDGAEHEMRHKGQLLHPTLTRPPRPRGKPGDRAAYGPDNRLYEGEPLPPLSSCGFAPRDWSCAYRTWTNSTRWPDVAAEGVHDPDRMPFLIPWTDQPPAERAAGVMRHHWRLLSAWTPEDWSLPLVVFAAGQAVGSRRSREGTSRSCGRSRPGRGWGCGTTGQGIGTEMRAAVLHLAFAELGAEEAGLASFIDNPASRRCRGSSDTGRTGPSAYGCATSSARPEPRARPRPVGAAPYGAGGGRRARRLPRRVRSRA